MPADGLPQDERYLAGPRLPGTLQVFALISIVYPTMNQSATRYFRTLGLLHRALCTGVATFAGIAVLLKYVLHSPATAPELQPVLLPVAIVTAIAGIAASRLLYKKRLDAIRGMTGLPPKADAYRAAQILRWALLEAATLFGIVGMLITMQPLFLAIAVVPFGLMVASRPTRAQGLEDMQLSLEEQAAWNGPDL